MHGSSANAFAHSKSTERRAGREIRPLSLRVKSTHKKTHKKKELAGAAGRGT